VGIKGRGIVLATPVRAGGRGKKFLIVPGKRGRGPGRGWDGKGGGNYTSLRDGRQVNSNAF